MNFSPWRQALIARICQTLRASAAFTALQFYALKFTEDKRRIRRRDRTKKLVGIIFVPGYFIFIVTKVAH